MLKRLRELGTHKNFVVCAALLLFDALLILPLCKGRALYWGDILLYFEPMHHFEREMLLKGQVPLWNPYLLGGQPFVGNPQMWVFFPTTPILRFVPAWLYLNCVCYLSLFLCGYFFYKFVYRWTRSEWASLMSGMVYMGSACIIARLQFPPMVMSALFCPLLLLLVDNQLATPHLRYVVAIAVSVGLLVLAAHPQMAYFILGISVVYVIMRLWDSANQEEPTHIVRWWVRRLMPFCVALIWGVGISAVQVLPVLQLSRESPREEMGVKEANRFYLEPKHLFTLISPHHWGHPATSDFRGRGNAWEPAIFIGWLPLVFIGSLLPSVRRRRVVAFWFLVAVLSIWLAFGMHAGLFTLAFYYLPGLARFHDPARFLYLTTLAFAFLAGIGAKRFVLRADTKRCTLLALGVAVPLIIYSPEWNPTVAAKQLDYVPPLSRPKVFTEGRVYIPHYLTLWRRFVNYNDYGRNDARTVHALINTLIPNIGMRYDKEMVYGYEPVPIAAPLVLEGLMTLELDRGEPNGSRLMSILNGTTLVQAQEEDVYHARLKPLATYGGMNAYANRDSLPLAWLVRSVRRVEGRRRLQAVLTDPNFVPAQEAIVTLGKDGANAEELVGLEGAEVSVTPSHSVVIQEKTEHKFVFNVDTGDRPAMLLVSLAAYPGWRATCDGNPLRLFRADGAITGMVVPAGTHNVTLRFEPTAYRVGLYFSLIAVAGAVGCIGFLGLGRRLSDAKE